MNYLFFDIECASHFGGVAKICSFGYVLCDTDFHILQKKDIVISPVSDFSKEFLENGSDFFAYPIEYFYTRPNFEVAYRDIRNLITDENNILIGHATACDASYISQNINFYGLEHFDFFYLDTQKMHSFFTSEPHCSLEKLCEIYGVKTLRAHRSDDDAEMTARIASKICKIYAQKPEDMLKNKSLVGVCHRGIVHDNLSAAFPISSSPTITPSEKALLRKYLSETVSAKKYVPGVSGTSFIFDESYEHKDFIKALYVINKLRQCGGTYTVRSSEAQVFVACSEKGNRGIRLRSAAKQKKRIISLKSLLSLLEIDEAQLTGEIDTDAVFGNTEESKDWYEYYQEYFALSSTQI